MAKKTAGRAASVVVTPDGRVKVRATKLGIYADRRRRPGDVFTISADTQRFDTFGEPREPRRDKDPRKSEVAADGTPLPREFSTNWMELVDADTPERTQTSVEAQRSANVDKPGATTRRLKPNAADPVEDAGGDDPGDEI